MTTSPDIDPVLTVGDGLPETGDVRAYVAIPESVLPDDDLERMWGAAIQNQHRECHHTDDAATWPAPLVQALLRRVQRQVAGRNLPLGVLDIAAEYGPARIPLYDAMVTNLEESYRRLVVA